MVASTLTFSPSSVVVMTAFMVESVRSTPLMYPTRVPKAFLGNPINNNYQSVIKLLELNLKIIPFLQGGDINDFHLFTYLAFSRRSSGGVWLTGTWGQTAKIPLNFIPLTIPPTILGRAAGATALPVSHPTGLWAGGPSPPHTPLSVHWKRTKIKVKLHPVKILIIYRYIDFFFLWNILKL